MKLNWAGNYSNIHCRHTFVVRFTFQPRERSLPYQSDRSQGCTECCSQNYCADRKNTEWNFLRL
jgi:hypothetical protein